MSTVNQHDRQPHYGEDEAEAAASWTAAQLQAEEDARTPGIVFFDEASNPFWVEDDPDWNIYPDLDPAWFHDDPEMEYMATLSPEERDRIGGMAAYDFNS